MYSSAVRANGNNEGSNSTAQPFRQVTTLIFPFVL